MKRLQRLRATAALRDMVSEIGFGQSQLIQPLFLSEGAVKEEPIAGLPGTSRHTLASLLTQFEKDLAAGVRQFLLFPVPAHKSNRNFAAEFVGTALQPDAPARRRRRRHLGRHLPVQLHRVRPLQRARRARQTGSRRHAQRARPCSASPT